MEPRAGEDWWVSYKGQEIVMHVYEAFESLRFRYVEGRFGSMASVSVESPEVKPLVRIPRASKIREWGARAAAEFDADLG